MSPLRPEAWIEFLQRLADRADAVSMRHFRSPALAIHRKSDGSPVTDADIEVERDVVQLARELAPGIGILGEELGALAGTAGERLIIDPIDATENFLRGDPVFATLLAVECRGRVVAGLVSAPALQRRWWAAKGGGAWRDGDRIRVSARSTLSECRLFHGTRSSTDSCANFPGLAALIRSTRADLAVGDFLQHVLVAEGLGDAAIDLELEPWDIAALQIIVEEAGGCVTAVDGGPALDGGTLVSTNGHLHSQVLAYLWPASKPGARQGGYERRDDCFQR